MDRAKQGGRNPVETDAGDLARESAATCGRVPVGTPEVDQIGPAPVVYSQRQARARAAISHYH